MPVVPMVRTKSTRRVAYFAAAAVLLGLPTLAIADETFVQQATVFIPGGPLKSFDISWVDPTLHTYFLADRTHKSLDLIDTHTKNVTQIIPSGADAFAGPVPGSSCFDGQANDCAGPNGVLTLQANRGNDEDNPHGHNQIWAGDGPTPQSKSTTGATCAAHPPLSAASLNGSCSTVKIFELGNKDPVRIIPTNGQGRADELCFDPKDHLVMIANDADDPPFITFISTEGNNRVLGQVTLPQAKGGVEQCQWNPRNGLIYLALPAPSNKDGTGTVIIIDPRHETILDSIEEDVACSANGLAIGPGHQILVGCNDPTEAAILDDSTNTFTTIPGEGGSDEVWFNPGDGHYFLGESKNAGGPQLGIVDSRNDHPDPAVPGTGSSSHSVAADPVVNQAYVPVNAGSGQLCGTFAANPADASTDIAEGCVVIFGASGPDDHPAFVYRDRH